MCFLLALAGAAALQSVAAVIPRTVTEAADPVRRTRSAGRTWLFSERQPYLPMYNFIPEKYIDRPLFTDVSLRRVADSEIAAFYRDIDILKWSGFDGFGSIAYPNIYRRQLAELAKKPVADYVQFPILYNFPRDPSADACRTMKEMILAAAASPVTMKLDGRPLIWWWGNYLENTYGTWRYLRTDPEIPPFVFLPSPPQRGKDEPAEAYAERLRARLRETDGFKLELARRGPLFDRHEHGLTVTHHPYFATNTLPIFVKVFEEPEFRGRKYLGANLEQAYINQLNGNVTSQNGTDMLRVFLDEAMLFSPDFLVGFEWNEANENTSFQPTASGAGAVARVCAYYKAMLNGGRLSPRPGDDVSIPNLVVSTRRSLISGEKYHVEFLYVPDGVEVKPFRARVVVKDDAGAVRAECPWETLPVAKLTAFDYRMDGDGFDGANAVYPVVEVEKDGVVTTYAGFDSAKINPTWCIDYLYTRTPLRELIRSPKADLAVKAAADGVYEFRASFACDEELASVEIMEGNAEKVAADRENRFDRAKYVFFKGSFNHFRTMKCGEATFDVEGSRDWYVADTGMPWPCFTVIDRAAKTGPRRVKFNPGGSLVPFILAVGVEDVDKARFVVSMPPYDGQPPVSIAELVRRGRYSAVWKNDNLVLDLERCYILPDYAVPLNAKSASIAAKLPAISAHPVFHLRAIAKSGHVWRSEPVVPAGGEPEPDLVYDFGSDAYGSWIPITKGDRRWWARLGCGWGGGEPMWWEAQWKKDRLPAAFRSAFPERVTDEGRPALSFDGSGQYIVFPRETIPCETEYALLFEMKPATADNQTLIRMMSQTDSETTLRLLVKDGELFLSHFGFCMAPCHFTTGLKVRPGEWQTVRIVRRASGFDVFLDDQRKHIDYSRWGLRAQSVIFGSNIQPGSGTPPGLKAFSGLLRSFRVQHRRRSQKGK